MKENWIQKCKKKCCFKKIYINYSICLTVFNGRWPPTFKQMNDHENNLKLSTHGHPHSSTNKSNQVDTEIQQKTTCLSFAIEWFFKSQILVLKNFG